MAINRTASRHIVDRTAKLVLSLNSVHSVDLAFPEAAVVCPSSFDEADEFIHNSRALKLKTDLVKILTTDYL